MKKYGAVLVLAGLSVAAWALPAFAATQTVTGRVIDLTCYVMDHKDVGSNHVTQGGATEPNVGFACDYACVRWQGMPAGLLTADGKVYQIAGGLTANRNEKIAAHLGHTVTITGEVTVVDTVTLIAANDVTMVKPQP